MVLQKFTPTPPNLSSSHSKNGRRKTLHFYQKAHDIHTCNIPDVQKDAEFIIENLNDPNFDLSQLPSSISIIEEEMTKRYVDQDCHGAINLDE